MERSRGLRPATIHPRGPTDPLDFDSLIDVITSTVRPTSWEDVGGPGSLRPDEPKMALVVSQTQANQDAVLDLLTLLRRSRLGTAEPVSPYERPELTPAGPLLAPWPASDPPPLPLSAMPQPTPEDIQALEARRSPERDRWVWRRTLGDGPKSHSIEVRRQGRRLEIRLPDRILRADGDAAAIAWPGLGIVELGNWGESVRQVADRWLPWLPHRTNEELGRLFHASRIDGRLRLVPRGVPASSQTWLEGTFGDGREPAFRWQSWLDGKLTGELGRVSAGIALLGVPGPPARNGTEAVPYSLMLLADGKPIARWEPLAAETGPGVTVPAVEADWPGYVRLDRRSKLPAVDGFLADAIEAIGRSDWPAALDRLREGRKTQPRQPLLLFLTAWCLRLDPKPESVDQTVALLKDVGRQGFGRLARQATEANFPSLSAAQRYEVLLCQPDETRTAADRDRLAQAAAKAGRLDEALAQARAALAAGSTGIAGGTAQPAAQRVNRSSGSGRSWRSCCN